MMTFLHQTVSHDMMCPINNIKQFVVQMLKAGQLGNEADMKKFSQLILESAKLLSSRMKDLLDQGLIEHGSFVPVEVLFTPNQAVS